MTGEVTLVVLAKSPRPGYSKTRLCPPLDPLQAASLADAALQDVIDAATAVADVSVILALDGPPPGWLPEGPLVVPQRGADHAERIGNAMCHAGGPALLIGMDTPQVTPQLLRGCADKLMQPGCDALLGRAFDGGWWICGMKQPRPEAFIGVAMSRSDTAALQLERFVELGLRPAEAEPLWDFDEITSAMTIADAAPDSRFAARLRAILSVHTAK